MKTNSNSSNSSVDKANGNTVLSKKDFETDQDVRWCPGCGDYSILATMQRFLPSLGIPKENFVFVSGIGCAARFPYYMDTYGFHTIHGRAPAIATGLKSTRPELSVWLVTGDGDSLSIGANHFVHLLRRNPNINVLLFNNRIYGLTKGQYSPTSVQGKVTKSSPRGSVEKPLNPILLALGAQGSFIARSLDVDAKHLTSMLALAEAHQGTSLIEIYQNCNIFNDGAFDSIRDRSTRDNNQLFLRDDKPLVYGKKNKRGLKIVNNEVEVISLESESEEEADKEAKARGVTTYSTVNTSLASTLATLPPPPEFPVPMGIFFQEERPTFEAAVNTEFPPKKQTDRARANKVLSKVFSSGDTWIVA